MCTMCIQFYIIFKTIKTNINGIGKKHFKQRIPQTCVIICNRHSILKKNKLTRITNIITFIFNGLSGINDSSPLLVERLEKI